MNGSNSTLLSLAEIRKRQRAHFLSLHEIPTGHTVSFPLPTRRFGNPAYAFFASPALRLADRPVEQGAPDRWWLINAHGGRLVMYTLASAFPLAIGLAPAGVLTPPSRSVAELQQATRALEEKFDQQLTAFFAGQPGDPGGRGELKRALLAVLPAEVLPHYRALTPDFWSWLEAL